MPKLTEITIGMASSHREGRDGRQEASVRLTFASDDTETQDDRLVDHACSKLLMAFTELWKRIEDGPQAAD